MRIQSNIACFVYFMLWFYFVCVLKGFGNWSFGRDEIKDEGRN